MKLNLKEFVTKSGEILLYTGNPDFEKLEALSLCAGDIWHSSFEQGYKNAFPELVYQTAIFFWYINDFDGLDECISWRINPNGFAVRKSVWEYLKGFDADYNSPQIQALHFGYNALRFQGAIPLYVRGLFSSTEKEEIKITVKDRYIFFRKNFKVDHSLFMIYREGFWKINEWQAFFYARKHFRKDKLISPLAPRALHELKGNPSVSYIIPTMFRQDYTLQLIEDLANQKLLPSQVIVVDATPENQRDELLYANNNYPFELKIIWQQSKGSCRARNEAIVHCTGEYIVFGDDDIRVPDDFLLNHVRLLQTYKADACNGFDIRADHHQQNLSDLNQKLAEYGNKRWIVGATQIFSSANSCVKREYVSKLVGNDINYDGGYGEDLDFGLSLVKIGAMVLHNPFSVNLHLKPPAGGYRFWGAQAKIMGKKRKAQPWELDTPVKTVRPVPSPTIMYMVLKQYNKRQLIEYRNKYFFLFLVKGSKWSLPYRILRLPYKQIQFNKSLFYAKKLMALGKRTQ